MDRKHRCSSFALLIAALLLPYACTDRLPVSDDGTSTSSGSTTVDVEASTTVLATDSSVDGASETAALDSSGGSSTGDALDCQSPQTIPPPPVDCRGAQGVHEGDVLIDDSPRSADPSILQGVRRVEGSIRISRTALTDLDFMACVQEVTGDVTIFDNDALTSVDGLWSLTTIGTDFVFSQNDALVVFDGLPNVETLATNLIVNENAALQEITGFHRLEAIVGAYDRFGELYGGNLTIQHNPMLVHIDGLGGLRECQGVFAVNQNPWLCASSVACVGSGIEIPATPPRPPLESPYADC